MENTNQLKRGGIFLLNSAKAAALGLNMTLGIAGDLDEWLKDSSAVWNTIDANSLKKCGTSSELAIEVRSYMVAKFKGIVIFNKTVEELTEPELARLAEIEVELKPKFKNVDMLKCVAFKTLVEELDS